MDVVLLVALSLAGIGAITGFILLVRREVRFRRLPSDAERTPPASTPLDAQADAWNAQVMRGTGGVP
ncbi:hypothetical protein [Mycetocola sp.]|uniref:hypothetical protein n=1 Tax=Mycetocola sp. TaxID=1871042 RepID=UPI003989083D